MKNKKLLISIITPCRNMGKFLEECVQSVLTQDNPHVEHIIQDAGSTDKTRAILKKYSMSKYHERIKWVSEPDSGQTDGLNKAIQRSAGDILLVLNADDVLMSYACSWAIAQFKLFPKMAVIYGDVFIIDEKGAIQKIGFGRDYDFEKLFCLELVPPAQAAFIQRPYFEKVGFYADATLDTCPDFEMWVRIGLKFPMKHVPGIISKYRAYPHDDSGKPRSADRFFTAKKMVIDRVLNNPNTPRKIKRLKSRAYQGLSFWAAHEARGSKNFDQFVSYFIGAFFFNPSIHAFKLLLNTFLDSPLHFISLISRGLLQKIAKKITK